MVRPRKAGESSDCWTASSDHIMAISGLPKPGIAAGFGPMGGCMCGALAALSAWAVSDRQGGEDKNKVKNRFWQITR